MASDTSASNIAVGGTVSTVSAGRRLVVGVQHASLGDAGLIAGKAGTVVIMNTTSVGASDTAMGSVGVVTNRRVDTADGVGASNTRLMQVIAVMSVGSLASRHGSSSSNTGTDTSTSSAVSSALTTHVSVSHTSVIRVIDVAAGQSRLRVVGSAVNAAVGVTAGTTNSSTGTVGVSEVTTLHGAVDTGGRVVVSGRHGVVVSSANGLRASMADSRLVGAQRQVLVESGTITADVTPVGVLSVGAFGVSKVLTLVGLVVANTVADFDTRIMGTVGASETCARRAAVVTIRINSGVQLIGSSSGVRTVNSIRVVVAGGGVACDTSNASGSTVGVAVQASDVAGAGVVVVGVVASQTGSGSTTVVAIGVDSGVELVGSSSSVRAMDAIGVIVTRRGVAVSCGIAAGQASRVAGSCAVSGAMGVAGQASGGRVAVVPVRVHSRIGLVGYSSGVGPVNSIGIIVASSGVAGVMRAGAGGPRDMASRGAGSASGVATGCVLGGSGGGRVGGECSGWLVALVCGLLRVVVAVEGVLDLSSQTHSCCLTC